jgi:hypothetical protein
MKIEQQIGRVLSVRRPMAGFVIGVALGLGTASAQSVTPAKDVRPDPELRTSGTRFVMSATETTADVSALRTIDDPTTGHRWLLIKDVEHPGGPGKLILSKETPSAMPAYGVVAGADGSTAFRSASGASARPGQVPGGALQPQIRSGDRLVVEEHSQVADVPLTAVALGPAMIGSVFKARLEIGGRVVSVVAEAPGRASFAAGRETHP